MAEKEGSRSFQSTARFRTHRTVSGDVNTARVRTGFLLGVYFAMLTAVVAVGGKPIPFKPGEPAPYDIRARISFRYPDSALRDAARQTAISLEPGTYTVKPGWLDEVLSSLRKVLSAVKQAKTDKEAGDSLRQEGIDVEITPFWRVKVEKNVEALDGIENRLRELLKTIGENGVMDDFQYADEVRNGHAFIRVKEGETARTVQLARGIGMSEVRQQLAQKVDAALNDYPDDVRRMVSGRLMAEIVPNLEYSERETTRNREAAAAAVKEIYTQVNKDERLAVKGVVMDNVTFRKILEEENAFRRGRSWYQNMMRLGGLVVVVSVLMTVSVLIIGQAEPQRRMTLRRWIVLGMLFLVVVAVSRLVGYYLLQQNLAPIGLVVLPVAMIFSLATAVTVALIGSALITVAVSGDFGYAFAMSTAMLVGVLLIRDVRRRSTIIQTGAAMGAVWFVIYLAYRFLGNQDTIIPSLVDASYGLANGLATGAVVAGFMPFIDMAFKTTTNISLLELSDQNHPAMRDLLVRASGTYHHSLVVGNIAEAAARDIGADPLLARVASYFHDIGKMTKPEYFVENQPPGRSPHDGLSPSMSALVIISHVKDGTDLAREYTLPDVIVDVIRQHHGTTLVEFFFRRAQETGEDRDKNMSERLFHYPGPLPESREAAIVMVADSVEAASRSLSDPSPAHIDNLVGTIIQRRLMEGQFDESGLAFKDLSVIRGTITKVLVSMFHSRPRYPGQKEE